MKWTVRLRQLRRRLKLSQRELSKLLGSTHSVVGNWERNVKTPDGGNETLLLLLYSVTSPDNCPKRRLKQAVAEMRKELNRGRPLDALIALIVFCLIDS